MHLFLMRPCEWNHRNIEQWLRDAKSILEQALKIDDKDYETMFQLGMVHYYLLQNDTSLKRQDDFYLKLCHDALEYFKQVQEKAPSVYNDSSMLEKIEAFFPIDWSKLSC